MTNNDSTFDPFSYEELYSNSDSRQILLSIVLAGTFSTGLIGLVLNVFLIWLILVVSTERNKPLEDHRQLPVRSLQPYEQLIVNLAVVDVCISANNVFLQTPVIANSLHGPLSMMSSNDRLYSTVCKVSGFAQYYFGMLSLTMPSLVVYNRYLALFHKEINSKRFTTPKTLTYCLACWLLSCLFYAPFLYWDDYGFEPLGVCGVMLRTFFLQLYLYCSMVPIFALNILSVYWSCKNIAFVNQRSTSVVNRRATQRQTMQQDKELSFLMALVIVVPMLTQSPNLLCKLGTNVLHSLPPVYSHPFTAVFALPSAVNPLLTVFIIRRYKRCLIRLFGSSSHDREETVAAASHELLDAQLEAH